MRRTDFAFHLPEELIAHYPMPERTQSRLLCVAGNSGEIVHGKFTDLLSQFNAGDLLILNNTKVMPARVFGKKASGGKIEILVERILPNQHLLVHCKASKRPVVNSEILLADHVYAMVIKDQDGLLEIALSASVNIIDFLQQYGHMPLPPYIKRADENLDQQRYQTVYAKYLGSVAAPTAGLHFDETLLQQIKDKGVNIAYVTLHVGAGTFQSVRVDNLKDHVMHAEYAELSAETCAQIQTTKKQGKRVIAVGTTSVRTIESAAISGEIQPYAAETRLFIKPGFHFNVVDAMVTNFHLPESTLLMLVCAFAGYDNVMHAYQEAVSHHYRFFSYGDAMFLTRKNHAI